uniref:Pecanex-like protein n=1 Tax=Romanomermis culicivorax TaxID=13658 RepID=A0A915JJ35_ROMCU
MSVFSHFVEILQQGVWASLAGGWYYDPKRSTFCNTTHMYIWLVLFIFPLTLRFYFEINLISILIYCSFIGLFFAIIKSTNFYLHSIFDTHELIEQEIEAKISDVVKDDKSKDKSLELGEFGFRRGESDKSIGETNSHKEHENKCASSSSSTSQESAYKPLLKSENANLRIINVDLHEHPPGIGNISPNSCLEIHDEKVQTAQSDSEIIDKSSSSKKIRLDLDAAELHDDRRAEGLSEDIILQASLSEEVFDRKYSEPVVFGFPEDSFEGTT